MRTGKCKLFGAVMHAYGANTINRCTCCVHACASFPCVCVMLQFVSCSNACVSQANGERCARYYRLIETNSKGVMLCFRHVVEFASLQALVQIGMSVNKQARDATVARHDSKPKEWKQKKRRSRDADGNVVI